MEQKVEFICEWLTGKYTITELSKAFEVSRPTAYRLIRRYEIRGINGIREQSKAPSVPFLETSGSYYDGVDERLPDHGEDLARLRDSHVLIDGGPDQGGGLLLQIFTENLIGPIFFEIIERKGNQGFGEGNFKALFEAMEQDQIKRGVLKPGKAE